jgi:GntR family transcriptional regulator
VPRVERPAPPFVQISDYLRDQIHNGTLAPGERLPSIAELAREWGVATATAAKAVTRLQVERAVWSDPTGTFVSADERISRTPGERIRAARPARPGPGAGEKITVTAAEIITAPDYVAGLLQVDPGSDVIRREEITTRRGRPRMLAVDWIPAGNVMEAAELLDKRPIDGGPEHVITTITGRHITHAQDYLESRGLLDAREASALQAPIGSPCLAGTHVWSDEEGPLLYGEWVLPAKVAVSYEYDVSE